jgi:sulfotransferase
MHVITGLPRSGSTLLCNVLNQNPKFHATSTSILPQITGNLIGIFSTSPEVKGYLHENREETEEKLKRSVKAFCEAWNNKPDQMVFDKSRGWIFHLLALRTIWPESKVVVTVRDLRNIFASVETRHRSNGLLDEAKDPKGKTIDGRALGMFSPTGLIGAPLIGIQDALNRKLSALYIRYEDLAANPRETMERLYKHLGEPFYEHDFENVENTATDPDWIYMHKYPHDGSGRIEPRPDNAWQKVMHSSFADVIQGRFDWFNERFKYPPSKQQQQMQQMQRQRQAALTQQRQQQEPQPQPASFREMIGRD